MDQIYIVEEELPVYFLDCDASFRNLTENEKKYSLALIKAGWYGALIDLVQCSAESPALFLLSQKLFRSQNVDEIEKLIRSLNYDDTDVKNFFNYFALFYDNLGNYRSFGDSKFIPRLDEEKFNRIITNTEAYKTDEQFRNAFGHVKSSIYSLAPRLKQMGLGEEGISTYYSYNCTMDDVKLVQNYLDQNNISPYNTRVFKHCKGEKTEYEVRQASALKNIERELTIQNPPCGVHVRLVNGDYRELMGLMVSELKNAVNLALNETEKQMINCYISSFETGSIDDHKEGSRHWIRDKNPIVENYIGFIESYRDPLGVRGEFEAFIAVVNKEMSRKFESLVNGAPNILAHLPWPSQYEKDEFLQPDFTSLDIINFPNSGMPVGINIPNYDDIRQNLGFKNVSLGNVLKARFKDPKSNFVADHEKQLFIQHVAESFEIQVGLHELIGHGSGKLFQKKDGNFNFDYDKTRDLLTNGPITSWYNENDTYDTIFNTIGSPFEECRAECVGLYLCTLPEVLMIFGHTDAQKASDVAYVNWLSMIKSALTSMEFYSPDQRKWRQAHCNARFVILQVLLSASENLVRIETVTSNDGKPDIVIHLDRSKIESVGRPAIGQFLKRLQYYKSTANFTDGSSFFNSYSILNEEYLQLRQIVIDRKLPRGIVIQSVIMDCNNEIQMVEYPNTTHGMIQSFLDRFSNAYGENAEKALHDIWIRDVNHFK